MEMASPRSGASPMVAPPAVDEVRDRSSNMLFDSKFGDLNTALSIGGASAASVVEDSGRPGTSDSEKNNGKSSTLRLAGCSAVEQTLARLCKEQAPPLLVERGHAVPQFCLEKREDLPPGKQPADVEPEHKPSPDAKRDCKLAMNRSLRRLFQDFEFANDKRLEQHAHKLRCKQVDLTHDWLKKYDRMGQAVEMESRPTPPFLRFSNDDPVMPGSRRVTQQGLLAKTHSASSPILPNARTYASQGRRASSMGLHIPP